MIEVLRLRLAPPASASRGRAGKTLKLDFAPGARHTVPIRSKTALVVAALLALVGIFYVRPEFLLGTGALAGMDYDQLHVRRITFAREALFGPLHALPGWYPRELLGSPFAANLQSFPWIPTRLVLLLLDPLAAYAAGVAIAAVLSAIFTYLYCRRAGLTRVGAFAGGGTFACAGYFASRVMAGHLPLLEAYPALPLLLWLVDRALATERALKRRFDLAVLAASSACVVVAGHPQVPAYAVASALLYTAWRGKGWLRAQIVGSIVLGTGLALIVWWPMLLLIGRSTRVLPLEAPDNDIGMPYGRLLALIVPGLHGWAAPVELAAQYPFTGYPDTSYFWDTASYVGILPLLAIGGLLVACIRQKRMPQSRWMFLACLGTGALLGSLPLAGPLLHALPGTLLRSPARLLYLSTFCAAVALGVAVDAVRCAGWPRRAVIRSAILAVALSLHFVDLWGFAHRFIEVYPRDRETLEFDPILARETGDRRIAEERENYVFTYQDRHDDAGGFDSIFLARTNRGLLALTGDPPGSNVQEIDASDFPVEALQATGVRFVIMTKTRDDLELVSHTEQTNLYRVPNAAPRAQFFDLAQIEFVDQRRIPELFAADPGKKLLLAPDARQYSLGTGGAPSQPPTVAYSRPSSDEIRLQITNGAPGFVYVLEAYDPGWSASVDNAGAPLVPANGFAMAVPVDVGTHIVRLMYKTTGRALGLGLSLLSLTLLGLLIWRSA